MLFLVKFSFIFQYFNQYIKCCFDTVLMLNELKRLQMDIVFVFLLYLRLLINLYLYEVIYLKQAGFR